MRKLCLAVAVAAAFGAGPALAADEPPLSNATEIVGTTTAEYLSALVTEMGGQQVQIGTAKNGEKVVTFVDGAIPYNLSLTNCESGKCSAFVMVVVMDAGQTNYPLEMLNNYNSNSLFSTVARAENKIGVTRGMVIESGVTRRNLAINIGVFTVAVQHTIQYLTSQNIALNGAGQSPFDKVSGAAGLRPVRPMPDEVLSFVKTTNLPKPKARLN